MAYPWRRVFNNPVRKVAHRGNCGFCASLDRGGALTSLAAMPAVKRGGAGEVAPTARARLKPYG